MAYFGILRGLERRAAERAAAAWLERVGLADRAHERPDALSKGNQQKVQLAAALVHRPAIAFLDEPFSGLDPVNQELFLDLLREMRDDGNDRGAERPPDGSSWSGWPTASSSMTGAARC